MPAAPLPRGDVNTNPPNLRFWELVREDFSTHNSDWLSRGFWTLFWHRFGNQRMSVSARVFRAPLTLIYRVMSFIAQVYSGIKLDYTVQVGRRVKLEHFGGMILGARSIGDDVIIRQNTTFGVRSIHDLNAKPIIGSRVDIGAGVVIAGDIIIGDDCSIGANCVVSEDIPARSRVRAPKCVVVPR